MRGRTQNQYLLPPISTVQEGQVLEPLQFIWCPAAVGDGVNVLFSSFSYRRKFESHTSLDL